MLSLIHIYHKTAVGREMGERFDRDAMEVTDEVFTGPQSIVFLSLIHI